MESLYKKYKNILEEQATQRPVYEDDRKNTLVDLKKIAILKTKIEEYNEIHSNIIKYFQQLQSLSKDPVLIEYASKLNNSMGEELNPQEQEQLTLFQAYHFNFFNNMVDHFKLSPLDDQDEQPE